MINIKNKSDCCGCFACFNACPFHAIEMIEDDYGFKYPKINTALCKNCGICIKSCPIIHENKTNNILPQAYSAINKNENIRLKSSSGGIFSLIANDILKNNGVVFGAKFDESFNVIHYYTENIEELDAFRRSKYTQSSINNCYEKAKQFLEANRLVLFTGTPCQIEGLKSFLGKDYQNLYTQDLICHGVPSPKVWRKYLGYRTQNNSKKIIEINFRNKDTDWKNFNMHLNYNTDEYKTCFSDDLYMNAFLKNICLRDSCYDCKFKKISRVADITLADFWGVDKLEPDFFDNKGTSLIILHSEKGLELFKKIKEDLFYKNTDLEKAITYNKPMIQSCPKHPNTENFFNDLDKLDFKELVNKYLSISNEN